MLDNLVPGQAADEPAGVPPAGAEPPQPEREPWSIVLTPEQVGAWRRRIQAALEGTKPRIDQGKTNVARYRNQYLNTTPTDDTILVPTDFYYVEQKKSQLFHRLPEVFLKPEQPGLEDGTVVFQAALNKKLGPAGVNILPTIHGVIFDIICAVGYGAVKIGCTPILDKQQPTVPMQIAPGQVEQVPNILTKQYFISQVAAGDLIVPSDFKGTDFDLAPFLGHRFKEDLPDDATGGSDVTDERRLTPLSDSAKAGSRKQRTGYEVTYYASQFDQDMAHPDVLRTFTIYEDEQRQQSVVAKLSPYQRFDGRTVTGMIGHCVAPVVIRSVSDTWMPESDCTMARAIADELSKGRTQLMQFKNRSLPQVGYDSSRVEKSTLEKIERNEVGAFIGFMGGDASATWPITKGDMKRESFVFNDYQQRDLDRIFGIGQNQQSVTEQGSKTATELQLIQGASQSRLQSEQARMIDWFTTRVVPKFAAVLQLFADQQEYVALVGQDAERLRQLTPEQKQAIQQNPQAQVLIPWTKADIWGRYTFTVKMDSQLSTDTAVYREQLLKAYNFLANEPTVNRQALTQEVLKAFHFDPAKFTVQPPPKQPEPPSLSMSVKGEDCSPLSPQSPIILDALAKLGVPIDPNAVQAAMQLAGIIQQMQMQQQQMQQQAEDRHGGATTEAAKINKHPTEATGGMQGSGARAPVAPGGFIQ